MQYINNKLKTTDKSIDHPPAIRHREKQAPSIGEGKNGNNGTGADISGLEASVLEGRKQCFTSDQLKLWNCNSLAVAKPC